MHIHDPGRRESPGLEDLILVGRGHSHANSIRVVVPAHEEPGHAIVIAQGDHGAIWHVRASAVAVELAWRDERHIVAVGVVPVPERGFARELAQGTFLQEVEIVLVGRGDDRAVWVPEVHGERRAVDVTPREIAPQVFGHDVASLARIRVAFERQAESTNGRTHVGVERRIPQVPAHVHVIARGGPGGSFEPQDFPGLHFLAVFDEHGREVREHDVGTVPQIDVEMQTESVRDVFVVHVHGAANRREDEVAAVVRGVEVDVVGRGRVDMRVVATHALRAPRFVAVFEREVDRDGIAPAKVAFHGRGDGNPPAGHEEEEVEPQQAVEDASQHDVTNFLKVRAFPLRSVAQSFGGQVRWTIHLP